MILNTIENFSGLLGKQLGYDRKEQKEKSIELARKILNNAEIDDNVADAVLIGVFAAKTLRWWC